MTANSEVEPGSPPRTSRARPSLPPEELPPKRQRGVVVPIGAFPPLEPPVPPSPNILSQQPSDTLRSWLVTLIITAIGGVVRFWQLGSVSDHGTPIFDGKYYAVQGAEILRNGGFEDNAAFGVVVHPPLGKQLIAIGEYLFGYNPFGWRFASAVAGTLCILLVIRAARRLTGSTFLAGLAGVLLIADGISHVQARSALLDIFQELFILAAFSALLADRAQVRARLAAVLAGDSSEYGATSHAGVKHGARWWRFAAGLLLGAACAVKWSGLYWIAAFGVMCVLWDVAARRAAGIRRPVRAVVRRDLLPSLWSLAVLPILTYVASWWAWLASESAWARHILVAQRGADWHTYPAGASNPLKELAGAWQNTFWQWQLKILDFHNWLLTPTGEGKEPHPWESKPWSWPVTSRPVLYYSRGDVTGCGLERCEARIYLVGTPLLWWLSIAVLAWVLWRAIARLDWRYTAVLVAYCAGYLPWFLNLDRQMYLFYITPVAPFLVLGVVLVLGDILGRPDTGVERRLVSLAVIALYVGLVVANFAYLWPILNGDPLTPAELQMRIWLPSWG